MIGREKKGNEREKEWKRGRRKAREDMIGREKKGNEERKNEREEGEK